MSIDNPGNFLNADEFNDDDENDLSPVSIYGKALFKKSIDILNITTTIKDLLPEDPDDRISTAALMLENAHKIPAKIKGATGIEAYLLRMENAVIIKVNIMELKAQIWACEALHGIEEKYT